jgi:dihydrofolate synthase/folylpolyglutamate synthase
MKLGLDNIRELLSILGNPQNTFESIHIAGSNGKGSVSAMLAAALEANGYKTGLYTSPHLVDFRERIKINGEMIPEHFVANFLEQIWKDVERLHATFFEVTTALAFTYFAESGVQIALIETGLGGRLDATNVIGSPRATVITSISLEHTAQLGDTLEKIAAEKAGIMKLRIPAIVNVGDDLRNVFLQRAVELDSSILFVDDYQLPNEFELEPPLLGKHQEQNLRTVLATLGTIKLPLKKKFILEGIRDTQKLTGMRARLEEYSYPLGQKRNLRFLLDVAHNPDAFKFLKEYFTIHRIKPIVIAGFAKDKDIPAILKEIAQFASQLVCVAASTHRAIPSNELADLARSFELKTTISSTPKCGVDAAIGFAEERDTLLLTGSHFVIGDFLKEVEKKYDE